MKVRPGRVKKDILMGDDCGACLIGDDFGGDSPDFYSRTWRVAQKPHACDECREIIPVGARYEYVTGKWDDQIMSLHTCAACIEIAVKLSCDGSRTHGTLWLDAEESLFPAGTLQGCLNRLESVEAKQKLADRWRKWRGLGAA